MALTPHHTNWQGATIHARWVNKVLERCTSCSNNNKEFSLVNQMVEQGLQVTFDPNGYFCGGHEKPRQIDYEREKEWTIFTLVDVNMLEVNSMLFTHGKEVGDIGISHNWVGYVNIQCFKFMDK